MPDQISTSDSNMSDIQPRVSTRGSEEAQTITPGFSPGMRNTVYTKCLSPKIEYESLVEEKPEETETWYSLLILNFSLRIKRGIDTNPGLQPWDEEHLNMNHWLRKNLKRQKPGIAY